MKNGISKLYPLSALMILLLMMVGINSAFAFNSKATDKAFAALLSMPSTKPESGHWNFPMPEDFKSESEEKIPEEKLIAYLARQQKAGADFNAYRHFGTLLHHAIRAGLTPTAIWLLNHGADPKKTLKGGMDNALTLSQQYKREEVLKALKEKFGMEPVISTSTPITLQNLKLNTDADYRTARNFVRYAEIATNYPHDYPSEVERYPDRAKEMQKQVREWEEFVQKLSPDQYAKLFDEDYALSGLIGMYVLSPDKLDKALSPLPDEVLRKHVHQIFHGGVLRYNRTRSFSSTIVSSIKYSATEEAWRAVWRHLKPPIDYKETLYLPSVLQPELWPELFASGYKNHKVEVLHCLLLGVDTKDLKRLWPSLEKYFPDIRHEAPRLILTPSLGCYPTSDINEIKNKLLFLTSLGIKEPVIQRQPGDDRPEDFWEAAKPFLEPYVEKDKTAKPRFVDAKTNCQFSFNDAWYRELVNHGVVTNVEDDILRVYIENIQLIEIPGESDCALLVGGFTRVKEYISGPEDTFNGVIINPRPSCPSPSDRYEVWQINQGKIKRMETDITGNINDPLLRLVRDTNTEQKLYVQMSYWTCGRPPLLPSVLQWQETKDERALKYYSTKEIENALYDQCSDEGCRGISTVSPNQEKKEAASESTQQPQTDKAYHLEEFLITFAEKEYKEYQSAIVALDKPKLETLQAKGVPGDWTAEAIEKIGKSDLSLEEKRKRTAWIFADHKQLEKILNYQVLQNLAGWLPREDWWPLWKVISDNPGKYYTL